jgi:ribose transport system ATP-binding protein
MNKVRSEGNSVLFISHDIDEIMSLCDSVTILRDGCVTAKLEKSGFESRKIKRLMVGREIAENFYRTDYDGSYDDEVLLEADNISCGIIKNISIKLHRGEILGVGGLTDCGMHDLGKILFGLTKPDAGAVYVKNGIKITNAISAIHNGIGYVSKNRDKEAMMPVGSIRDNICLPNLKTLSRFGIIGRKQERNFVMKWAGKLSIKMSSIMQFCSALSGGNKQKVVLAKWLGKDSDILILDCPTRGIDVGVKASIYQLMSELKAKGKAILMISEELTEVIGMSDRILILKDGSLTGEFKRSAELSEANLIEHMI